MTERSKNKKEFAGLHGPYEENNEPPSGLGMRHLQAFILFLSISVSYGMRSSMGVAVVAMTTHSSENSNIQTFGWNKKTQDVVMTSFYWGYMTMQLPAGQLVVRFGGKTPIVIALVVNGLLNLGIPYMAAIGGWKAICAIRVAQGLTQAVIVPGTNSLLGKWVPVEERGRLGAFVLGGYQFGTVAMVVLAGYASATKFGWPSLFYAQGALVLAMGSTWFFVGANSPAEHKYISEKERRYIQTSLGPNTTKKLRRVPWRLILTSVPVWAICVAHAGQTWGILTIQSQIPAYMTKVLHANITESGFLLALPFLSKWVSLILLSFLFDFIVNRRWLSRVAARKLANTIGHWPVALLLIGVAFTPTDSYTVVEVLLIVLCGFFSGSSLGSAINLVDLSPNYAGTIASLSNFFANIMSIIAPLTAGFILTDDTDVLLWRWVFFICAGMLFVTNVVYLIFGSATVQPWDDPDYVQKDETKTKVDLFNKEEDSPPLLKLKKYAIDRPKTETEEV